MSLVFDALTEHINYLVPGKQLILPDSKVINVPFKIGSPTTSTETFSLSYQTKGYYFDIGFWCKVDQLVEDYMQDYFVPQHSMELEDALNEHTKIKNGKDYFYLAASFTCWINIGLKYVEFNFATSLSTFNIMVNESASLAEVFVDILHWGKGLFGLIKRDAGVLYSTDLYTDAILGDPQHRRVARRYYRQIAHDSTTDRSASATGSSELDNYVDDVYREILALDHVT